MEQHPLLLPEIVQRVGLCLSHWGRTKEIGGRKHDFDPSDLIAAISVCRAWRAILTPILWMVYEENMVPQWRIPQETLCRQSRHFRYLRLVRRHPEGVIASTHLRELDIFASGKFSASGIILSNPQLSSLSLSLGTPFPGNLSNVYPALSSLHHLEHLRLHQVRLNTVYQLPTLLNNNPKLSTLCFEYVSGDSELDGCKPLMNVKTLDFSYKWTKSRGLVHLVRLCPNLTRLDFLCDPQCPFDELTRTLRENCPKLQSIRCYESDDSGSAEETLEEGKILDLIKIPSLLVDISIVRQVFTTKVCLALLDHAVYLESVNLSFIEGNEETVRNVGRILAACPNLKNLRACCLNGDGLHDLSLDWFDVRSWKCPNIEMIDLDGFSLYCGELSGTGSPAGSGSAQVAGAFEGQGQKSVHGGTGRARKKRGAPLPLQHQEVDRKFLELIASEGWTNEPFRFARPKDPAIHQATRMIRNMVFDRTWDNPRIHRIKVESFMYVNKNRMLQAQQRA
ncbi:hypothetical protein BG003_009432 [Podila horticola]|nr:hypothetical protein BG003_009432 [Podila horticola]